MLFTFINHEDMCYNIDDIVSAMVLNECVIDDGVVICLITTKDGQLHTSEIARRWLHDYV